MAILARGQHHINAPTQKTKNMQIRPTNPIPRKKSTSPTNLNIYLATKPQPK
jgi:hypothetical protein